MSKHEPQSEGMSALEQSLNDHMEICRLKRKAKRLKAENARLKAEIDNSNRINTELLLLSNKQASEVRRLKAEVERLTERNKFLEQIDSYLQGANENAYEKRCDELEAEVERLRKAGDAMAKVIPDIMDYRFDGNECDKELKAWNAAKEGKQS